ncbi:MAG: acyltransferase [Eubacteriales bacterium]|nr:acyltransferase [Eubacteriales bacterium]
MLKIIKENIYNRDINLDILKIIGCVLVIFLHCKGIVVDTNGKVNLSNLAMESFTAICVQIFFITSGFYMYREDGTYVKHLKKLIVSVIVPYIILTFFCLFVTDWLLGISSFKDCIKEANPLANINVIWASLKYNTSAVLPNTLNHLWYIFSYGEIILFYPITKFIINKCPKWIKIFILIIGIFFLFQNDYRFISGRDDYKNIFFVIPKAIFLSFVGSLLYNNFIKVYIIEKKDNIFNTKKKKVISLLSIVYIVLMIISFFLQKDLYEKGGVYYFDSWDSGITFIRTVIICILIYLIDFNKIKQKLKNILSYLSSISYYIYLTHYIILQRFLIRYVDEHFRSKCANAFQDFAFAFLFTILVSVTTVIFCIIIKEVKDYFLKGIKSIYAKFIQKK